MASFCEHCEGQRFDRAQVLRALRRVRNELRENRCGKKVDKAIALALTTIVRLELPHMELERPPDEIVH